MFFWETEYFCEIRLYAFKIIFKAEVLRKMSKTSFKILRRNTFKLRDIGIEVGDVVGIEAYKICISMKDLYFNTLVLVFSNLCPPVLKILKSQNKENWPLRTGYK